MFVYALRKWSNDIIKARIVKSLNIWIYWGLFSEWTFESRFEVMLILDAAKYKLILLLLENIVSFVQAKVFYFLFIQLLIAKHSTFTTLVVVPV